MITLKKIVNNAYELTVGEWSILFSYETPVAAHSPSGYFRTKAFHSKTTNRHINAWLGLESGSKPIIIEDVPPSFFEEILSR